SQTVNQGERAQTLRAHASLTADGSPAVGAVVEMEIFDRSGNLVASAEGDTDASGNVSIDSPRLFPTGVLDVRVAILGAPPAFDYQIYVPPSAFVYGVVLDTSGHPIAGVSVTAFGSNSIATTDANGQFRLPGIPSGPQLIEFSRSGYATLSIVVNVGAGAT